MTCLICLIFDISWRSFVLEEKKEEGRCEICDSRIEKEEYGLMIEIDVNIGVNIDVGVE